MNLVFLDTPQIDLLEKARRIDPARYSSFRDAWKQRGFALVMTLAQQAELARYPDPPRRDGRYEVLADLAPIITDVRLKYRPIEPRTLIHREIVGQILERGLQTENGPGDARMLEWREVLPGRLETNEAILLRLNLNPAS